MIRRHVISGLAILALGLVAITFIDLEHLYIPDAASLGGTLLGLATFCARPYADGSGLLDCDGTAQTPDYNNTAQQDHNSNNGNDPDFDNDPTCTATFTNPGRSSARA